MFLYAREEKEYNINKAMNMKFIVIIQIGYK